MGRHVGPVVGRRPSHQAAGLGQHWTTIAAARAGFQTHALLVIVAPRLNHQHDAKRDTTLISGRTPRTYHGRHDNSGSGHGHHPACAVRITATRVLPSPGRT